MSPELIGLGATILLLILILCNVQVGVSLLLTGFLGYIVINGPSSALTQLAISSFGTVTSYSLSVMPMFILMGMLLSYSDLSKDLFNAVDKWVGHRRGGIGITTIGASAIFSSISGSASATTATIARVAIPEMRKYKYDSRLSTAAVAAGGTLGFLIPPSVILILYGVLTMEPIGDLLVAGLVPGILLALLFMFVIYIQIIRDPSLAPVSGEISSLRDRMLTFNKIWPFMLIFIVSIGGIYFGLFTPTEAGGVGAMASLVVSLLTKRMNVKKLLESLNESVRITSMIFLILIGATIYAEFLALTRIPNTVTASLANLDVPAFVIMLLVLLMLFVMGMFIEGIAVMVLTLPVLHPLVTELGFNGVWFGVIMCLVINIGLITPPLGVSAFIIHGVVKDISLNTIFRGAVPMVVTMLLFAVLLIIFPGVVTFLPEMMVSK